MLIVAILLTLLALVVLTFVRPRAKRSDAILYLLVSATIGTWTFWFFEHGPLGPHGNIAIGSICGAFATAYLLAAVGWLVKGSS